MNDITGYLFGQNGTVPRRRLRRGHGSDSARRGFNNEADALPFLGLCRSHRGCREPPVQSIERGSQMMSITNELQEMYPPLWGRITSQEPLQAEHHLDIFVTSGACRYDCQTVSSASAGGNSVTMIVEQTIGMVEHPDDNTSVPAAAGRCPSGCCSLCNNVLSCHFARIVSTGWPPRCYNP